MVFVKGGFFQGGFLRVGWVFDVPVHSAWNNGFSNQTSPPRTSRFLAGILKCPQAIRVEYQVSLHVLRHQCLQTIELDLSVESVLRLFLAARHVGFPSFDTRLEFQWRTLSKRNDRAKQVSFSSSFRRIKSFLQSSPCF